MFKRSTQGFFRHALDHVSTGHTPPHPVPSRVQMQALAYTSVVMGAMFYGLHAIVEHDTTKANTPKLPRP